MNLVDAVIVVAAVGYGWAGYRNGFLSGAASLIGFVLGALLGAQIAQPLGERLANGEAQVPVAIVCLVFCALFGQLLAVWLATVVRRRITWHPARNVDRGLGAVLGVLGTLVVAWMIALPLASAPYPSLARQVRQSALVHAIDRTMPEPMRGMYDTVRDFMNRSDFPEVFGALNSSRIVPVPAPDDALARSAVVQRTRVSVVKVYGDARQCGRQLEGSGFVFAPGRVMTNAHVVAGTSSTTVVSANGTLPATVVLYDPKVDVAVLAVPGLKLPALSFVARSVPTRSDAVVLGYPRDGPFDAQAARIRSKDRISGDDIYGNPGVDREVYSIRGLVRSGNSGGPLIDASGHVLGVVFASAIDDSDTGFVLTAAQVAAAADRGRSASAAVGTQGCD